MANVTEHRKSGKFACWKKYIGGRVFYLGTDRAIAMAVAEALLARAEVGELTPEAVAECFASSAPVASPVSTPVAPVAPLASQPIQPAPVAPTAPAAPPIGFHAAMDRYLESEKLRMQSRQIATATYVFRRDNLETAKEFPDCPLACFDMNGLRRMLAHWTNRPVREATDKPMSAAYASNVIRVLYTFFNWADLDGVWVGCRRWQDAWRGLTINKLSTPTEKKKNAKEFPAFTIDEAQVLWHAANIGYENRAMMGLALWTGETQMELATLLIDDFFEEDGELFCDRNRNKTGVYGRWWIPSEVAVYVRQWLNHTRKLAPEKNPNGLAFLTREGCPLVHYSGEELGRSDAIKERWDWVIRFAKQYGVRPFPFKCLRKTLSQEVRNLLGLEYSQAFCAQSQRDVQSQHYTHTSQAVLEKCLREQIYPAWKTMFDRCDLETIQAKLKKTAEAKATRKVA